MKRVNKGDTTQGSSFNWEKTDSKIVSGKAKLARVFQDHK